VATGIAPEAVIKNCLVGLSADSDCDKLPVHAEVLKPPNHVFVESRDIRSAPGEEVRSRLSEHVLHAISNKPGGHDGEGKAQKSCVEFP